jgi:ATP-binding cassette subfamily C (CFTR/MRP) protein 1
MYWHLVNRLMVMVRGSLIDMIYAKTMKIGTGNLDEAAALTLMSTDVENVVLGLEDMHELWANLAQAIIATWLLERQLSWACVAPIIISIGMQKYRLLIAPLG